MPEHAFPFPGFELAGQELSYDYCYAKIPEADRGPIAEAAWAKGAQAAKTIFERFGGETDFFAIAKQSGLKCIEVDKDYIVGNRRYFSDYLSGKKSIRLYKKSIALWARQNGLGPQAAANLILSHEFYHHLECTEIGLTSKEYLVPMLVLGPVMLGKTGIRALSEIGAHAFARTYYELTAEQEENHEQKTVV